MEKATLIWFLFTSNVFGTMSKTPIINTLNAKNDATSKLPTTAIFLIVLA